MSFCINNVYSGKSYTPLITSEYQSKSKDTQELQDDSKDAQKLQKKKQVISEQEGKFYCTYMVDEEGQKILLSKIPIAQVEKQNSLQNSIESDKTKYCDYKVEENAHTAFKYKQQLNLESTHRKSSREIMNILNGNMRNQSNATQRNINVY